jgi:hypothetical protein
MRPELRRIPVGESETALVIEQLLIAALPLAGHK